MSRPPLCSTCRTRRPRLTRPGGLCHACVPAAVTTPPVAHPAALTAALALPPPSVDETSEWAWDFLRTEEGEDYYLICQDPDLAPGFCCEVSEAFVDHLHATGEPTARTVDLLSTETHPHLPVGVPHTVVEVRGVMVDLTLRQFDPEADVPHTAPTAEFLDGWRVSG